MLAMIAAAREGLLRRYDVLTCRKKALSEKERLELWEIELALNRIETHTYGRCERCEGPIGRQRLRALPETTRCAECSG